MRGATGGRGWLAMIAGGVGGTCAGRAGGLAAGMAGVACARPGLGTGLIRASKGDGIDGTGMLLDMASVVSEYWGPEALGVCDCGAFSTALHVSHICLPFDWTNLLLPGQLPL